MNIKNTLFAAMALTSIILTSCKKDKITPDAPAAAESGSLKVNLEHKWVTENANFTLNAEYVHPGTNDTLNFTTLKYYVSNFRLRKADGTWWNHPESYFLVDLSNPQSTQLQMTDVPLGEYTAMEYTFGVDSLRNVSGAQSGALAISNNMFWSWNSGYIMLKAEGISPNSATGSYAFHLGGFTGATNVVSTKTIEFTELSLIISNGHQSEVHMNVHADQLWATAPGLSTTNAIHMPGTDAKAMANGFFDGFEFEHIHN